MAVWSLYSSPRVGYSKTLIAAREPTNSLWMNIGAMILVTRCSSSAST